MPRDSLRATLDNLQVDPESAQDRPYLEAMLRRLGYTEREIREELGPAPEPVAATDPAREYRLVVPARESAFTLEHANVNDAPLEGRVQFEVVDDDGVEDVEFETLPEEVANPAEAEKGFEPVGDTPGEGPEAERQADDADRGETLPLEEDATLGEEPIDTFGDSEPGAAPKTRVRVKRVRARSRADAEAKVATQDRRVIKSVPVDVVERWGGDEAEGKKGAR